MRYYAENPEEPISHDWYEGGIRTVWEKRLPAPQQEQDSPFILPSEQNQETTTPNTDKPCP